MHMPYAMCTSILKEAKRYDSVIAILNGASTFTCIALRCYYLPNSLLMLRVCHFFLILDSHSWYGSVILCSLSVSLSILNPFLLSLPQMCRSQFLTVDEGIGFNVHYYFNSSLYNNFVQYGSWQWMIKLCSKFTICMTFSFQYLWVNRYLKFI